MIKPKSIELKILIAAIIIVLAGELITMSVISSSSVSSMAILGMERLAMICLLIMLVSFWGKGLPSIGLGRETAVAGLKKGLLWSVLFGLAAGVLFLVLYAAQISPLRMIQTRLPIDTRELVLFFLVGGVIAPIAEEVFFRGIVYGFLRRWSISMAVVGTTVIFVAAHAIKSGVPVPQIVGGIVFAIAYEVEGNLLVPITIHVLGNLAIFGISLFW